MLGQRYQDERTLGDHPGVRFPSPVLTDPLTLGSSPRNSAAIVPAASRFIPGEGVLVDAGRERLRRVAEPGARNLEMYTRLEGAGAVVCTVRPSYVRARRGVEGHAQDLSADEHDLRVAQLCTIRDRGILG